MNEALMVFLSLVSGAISGYLLAAMMAAGAREDECRECRVQRNLQCLACKHSDNL